MDSFEYLITLVSVIAGLGIARALSGAARLLDKRRNISISWIPICWTINVLLWLVAFWWFTFLLSSFEVWSPWLHVFVLVYAGTIFFLLALLHPEFISDGHDTMKYFLENRKMFFGTLIVLALIDIADTLIKDQFGLSAPPISVYSGFMMLWIVIGGLALVTRNPKLHAVYAPMFLVVLIVWVSYIIPGILEIVAGAS
jgi:hypothetical protein